MDQSKPTNPQQPPARVVVNNFQEVRRGGKLLFKIDGVNQTIQVQNRGKVIEVDLRPYLDGKGRLGSGRKP